MNPQKKKRSAENVSQPTQQVHQIQRHIHYNELSLTRISLFTILAVTKKREWL